VPDASYHHSNFTVILLYRQASAAGRAIAQVIARVRLTAAAFNANGRFLLAGGA